MSPGSGAKRLAERERLALQEGQGVLVRGCRTSARVRSSASTSHAKLGKITIGSGAGPIRATPSKAIIAPRISVVSFLCLEIGEGDDGGPIFPGRVPRDTSQRCVARKFPHGLFLAVQASERC